MLGQSIILSHTVPRQASRRQLTNTKRTFLSAQTLESPLISGQTKNTLLNHLLLLARYFIYKNKFSSNYISLETFGCYVKRKYQKEKYISKLHQKQDNFNAKWSVLNNALQNIWTNFWQPSLQKKKHKKNNNKKHSTNMQNKKMLIKIKSYIYSCIPLKHWNMMSDFLRYTWMVKSCWIEQNTKKISLSK